jgi:hypothetical protein
MPPLFGDLVKSRPEVIASLASNTRQIGGDYLALHPDATLEIYRMVAGGEVVDVQLRYRRPATVPGLLGGRADHDEMLKFTPDIH